MSERTTHPTHGLDDDALRARLAATDPTAGTASDGPGADALVADVLARDAARPAVRHGNGRRIALIAGGLVAAAAVASALVLPSVLGDDDAPVAASDVLTVSAPPAQDAASASCVMVEAGFLDDFPVAFAGTVVEAGATEATLDVDRWFVGGDADQVRVDGLDPELAVNGYSVQFTTGQQYLVAVGEGGTVASCGFTGPADPALQAVYDEAFGG